MKLQSKSTKEQTGKNNRYEFPLTIRERSKICKAISKGVEPAASEAQEWLSTASMDWIATMVELGTKGSPVDKDEVLQDCWLSMLSCVHQQSPNSVKLHLPGTVFFCIEKHKKTMANRIIPTPTATRFSDEESNLAKEFWNVEIQTIDNNTSYPELSVCDDGVDPLEYREQRRLVKESFDELARSDSRRGEVLKQYLIDGMTFREMAEVHGITYQRLQQIEADSVIRLRTILVRNGFDKDTWGFTNRRLPGPDIVCQLFASVMFFVGCILCCLHYLIKAISEIPYSFSVESIATISQTD